MFDWKPLEEDKIELIDEYEYIKWKSNKADYKISLYYGIEKFDDTLDFPQLNLIMCSDRNIFNRVKSAFKFIFNNRIYFSLDLNLNDKSYSKIKKYLYGDSKYIINCSCIGHHGFMLFPWFDTEDKGKKYILTLYSGGYPFKINFIKGLIFIFKKEVIIDSILVDEPRMIGTFDMFKKK